MDSRAKIAELVAKAHAAQKAFEAFDQVQADSCVKAIYDNAEPLARWRWKKQEWAFMRTR